MFKHYLVGISLVLIFVASATPSFAGISPEASPLVIKGSRIFSFSSKSIEGTKEGFVAGINREESLRINIAGKVDETEVDANFFSTSLIGGTQFASREESVSILLKNGSTEAYFGDFTPEMDGLEFAKIGKVLSGLQVKGDNGNYGYKLIASSPKGESRQIKMYGDNSQGPYNLGNSPIVINSERVYVNYNLQKRGNDYDVDYQAGTITFKNKTINTISIIEIYYNYSITAFQHSTYAGRGKAKILENLRMGITYIDDADNLKDAESIALTTSIEPQSHQVFGIDGGLDFGPLLYLNGEAAISDKNLNILSPRHETGKAAKLGLKSNIGAISFSGNYKRIGAKFSSIGDALPKQDLTEAQSLLTYHPNDSLLALGAIDESKFVQGGTANKVAIRSGKVKLAIPKLPSAEYLLSDILESNDPVTSAAIDRITTKNSLEFQHSANYIRSSIRGGLEKRINRAPSSETITFKTINFGTLISPNEGFSFSSNLELKETALPNHVFPSTKTYIANISALPRKQYLINGSLNYTDDSQYGVTQVTNIAVKADPISQIKTNSKYSISTLNELFGNTKEATIREEGSFLIELRPIERLKIKYNLKPTATTISRTKSISYNNQSQQLEGNLFLSQETLLGYSIQLGDAYIIDSSDYPNFQRKKNIQDTNTIIYSLKTAPLQFLSCEFNYILDSKNALTLSSSGEPAVYNSGKDRNREFNATLKTSLSEKIAIDSSFAVKNYNSGSGESENNTINSASYSVANKIIYNLSNALSLSPSYTYSQSTNNLLSSNRETYTIAPGIGVIVKIMDRLRIDSNITYARSYAGTATESTIFVLRGKYDLSDYVHITLITNTEISKNPDYKTSELSGNVEINL